MYANICFILAIICFVVDGLGLLQNLHLLSWGSALFTAGFITWENRLERCDRAGSFRPVGGERRERGERDASETASAANHHATPR